MNPYGQNSRRPHDIGTGVYVQDACEYNTDVTAGVIITHAPCVAISNASSTDLIVGTVNADSSNDFDIAVNTLIGGMEKPVSSTREFNLALISSSYSTRTLSWTGVANTYYVIKVYSKDAPGATTTITTTSGKGVFVSKNSSATATAVTVTKSGISTFVYKVANDVTNPSLVFGAGFSASTDPTKPVCTVHSITAWTPNQLNILY